MNHATRQADREIDFASHLELSLGYRSRAAFTAFSNALAKRLVQHDVSISQWRFLRELWREDGPTQAELSMRVGSLEPTTVRVIDGLVRKGLATRIRSQVDRRKSHVRLTSLGRELQTKLLPIIGEINEIARKDVDPDDLETFLKVLEKITANLVDDAGIRGVRDGL